MYQHILIPVDDSLAADRALRVAGGLAARDGATLTSLPLRAAVGCVMAEWVSRQARELDADLIVLAAPRIGRLSSVFAESVGDYLVAHTDVPLLEVPEDPRPMRPGVVRSRKDFARILVPVDESAESRTIFGPVANLARHGVSQILLLRVIEQPAPSLQRLLRSNYHEAERDEQAMQTAVADAYEELTHAAIDLAARSDCDVDSYVIVSRDVAAAILKFAWTYNVSAIAMATHGSGASLQSRGRVTARLERESRLPLLLRRPPSAPWRGRGIPTERASEAIQCS